MLLKVMQVLKNSLKQWALAAVAKVVMMVECQGLSSVHAWLPQHCLLRCSSCRANKTQLPASSHPASSSHLRHNSSRPGAGQSNSRQPLMLLWLLLLLVCCVPVLLMPPVRPLVVAVQHPLGPGHNAPVQQQQQVQVQC
jgi:hypothetical protein